MIDYLTRTALAAIEPLGYAVLWTLLTQLVYPFLWKSTQIQDKYGKQNKQQKLDFDARATAAIHATLVFSLSAYAIFIQDEFTWKNVHSYTDVARVGLQLSAGYFLSDMIVCKQLGEYYPESSQYMAHHIVSVCGILLALRDRAAIWFVCCRLLTELSTPFVNLRFMMILFEKENTIWYKVNEQLGYWTFVVSRPLLAPFFWYCTMSHWNDQKFWNLDPLLMAFWIITAVGLDILNCIWFKTITIGYYNEQIKPLLKRLEVRTVSNERKRG